MYREKVSAIALSDLHPLRHISTLALLFAHCH
jgi:hypothetical protein